MQCWVIFFIESVGHDQSGGDQVTVIWMHPGRNAGHESVVALPGYQMTVAGGTLKRRQPFGA